eukprot:scaffold1528_cov198-Pinguiococcus_pyrenoidosus.AAC.4
MLPDALLRPNDRVSRAQEHAKRVLRGQLGESGQERRRGHIRQRLDAGGHQLPDGVLQLFLDLLDAAAAALQDT